MSKATLAVAGFVVLLLVCATAALAKPSSPPDQNGSDPPEDPGSNGNGNENGNANENGNGNGNGNGDSNAASQQPTSDGNGGDADQGNHGNGNANGNGNSNANGNPNGGGNSNGQSDPDDGGDVSSDPGNDDGVGTEANNPAGDSNGNNANTGGSGNGEANGNANAGNGNAGNGKGDANADTVTIQERGPSSGQGNGQAARIADQPSSGSGSTQASGPSKEGSSAQGTPAAQGDGNGHADSDPAAEARADSPAAPLLTDASHGLIVERGRAGNTLTWHIDEAAAQVQLWRLDAAGWVTVVAVPGTDGEVTDPDGPADAQYRLTWSHEALGSDALALAATTISLVPAGSPDAGIGVGHWLAAALWAGIGAFGLVRANQPRRLLEVRPSADHAVLPLLAGLPGVDLGVLERVSALGLRTVGQLRAIDADALGFWARVPARTVRQWKQTVELLVWPALPPGAAERLAVAGHGTLAHLAAARPAELFADLIGQGGLDGPGLPTQENDVAAWVIEARSTLGLDPPAPPQAPIVDLVSLPVLDATVTDVTPVVTSPVQPTLAPI